MVCQVLRHAIDPDALTPSLTSSCHRSLAVVVFRSWRCFFTSSNNFFAVATTSSSLFPEEATGDEPGDTAEAKGTWPWIKWETVHVFVTLSRNNNNITPRWD